MLGETFSSYNSKMLKKTICFLFLVSLLRPSYSQSNLYTDSIKVSDSTILIATSNQYKQFEFCIEKKYDIIKELKKLSYGEEKQHSYEKNPVVIKLVTKGKIIQAWNVRPASSVIEVEAKKYLFDTTLLSLAHKKFPINYVIEEKVFSSQKLQDEYYFNLLKDKSFLYIVPHDFENEWREQFNLTFRKNENFSSPAAIAKYLDTIISKMVPKKKYSITYSPFNKAKRDSAVEFTMTIYSINQLYDYYNDTNAIKSSVVLYPTYIIRKK